ncbi:MAG TPA: hypothetical protein DEP69_02470, partial [Acidimicrobiaceae bacterium]|nr:hypothetical protein [Acidimicrobiaceae bacterium]
MPAAAGAGPPAEAGRDRTARDRTGRGSLVLALDVADLDAACATARLLSEWFGLVKVGLELFAAAGPDAVRRLRDDGFAVFVDLKLHDIPTTVGRAARSLGRMGAAYATFHAAGGVEMLRAGVEGLRAGAAEGSAAGTGAAEG